MSIEDSARINKLISSIEISDVEAEDDDIEFNLVLVAELASDILILMIGKFFNSLICTDEYERGQLDAIDEMPLINTLSRIFDKKIWPHLKYEDIAAIGIFCIGCASGFFWVGLAISSLIEVYRIIQYN